MKKHINSIFKGITIGLLISILFSLVNGSKYYATSPNSILYSKFNDITVLIICVIFWALIGVINSISSKVYENIYENFYKKACIHYIFTLIPTLIAGFILNWITLSIKSVLIFIFIFTLVYIIIFCILLYISKKSYIEEINEINKKLGK